VAGADGSKIQRKMPRAASTQSKKNRGKTPPHGFMSTQSGVRVGEKVTQKKTPQETDGRAGLSIDSANQPKIIEGGGKGGMEGEREVNSRDDSPQQGIRLTWGGKLPGKQTGLAAGGGAHNITTRGGVANQEPSILNKLKAVNV